MDGRISNFKQLATLRRYTVTEGASKGLDVIDCDNGKLRFLLNVDKGCDMMQLYHEGLNVSFISKNGFTKREIPFLRRFEGGMIYTCGLDSVGGREGYELHGNFHNTPAESVRAECNEQGLIIEAEVRDTALFGKNLVLKRSIFSALGSEEVTLRDTLVNAGYRDEPYCLLYHVNVGYPMLDDGARVVADVLHCEARNAWSAQNEAARAEMGLPTPEDEETCYFLKLGTPRIALVNERIGKTLALSYSSDTLPCFVQWKSMVSGDYALGFEPATTELDDRFAYQTLKAAEAVSFALSLSVQKN